MKETSSIQDLEAERDRLLQRCSLPFRLASGDVPDALAGVAAGALSRLLGKFTAFSGAFGEEAELNEFVTDFLDRSEEGLRRCLESEIETLRGALETGKDQVERVAFGLREGVFPVSVKGQVVHVLRTGRFRDKPFSAAEISEIAEVSGASAAGVKEAAAAVPILNEAHTAALLALHQRLRDAIQAGIEERLRFVDLNHQLVQAERMRSLGTLSGGVAHHFNNLLSIILGYSSFVLNREDHSKEAADALSKIAEAAQRGRRLTEEILAFAGSDVEEEAPCHVHETLSNVLSLLESELRSQTRIERRLRAEQDVVLSPPSAMHQIVFNLVTNGLDSMPAGGVLTVATGNVELKSESGRMETYFKLEVTDSSGLPPETSGLEDVPERLAAEAAVPDRSSLRLSSVYGMVGRMDGTITVTTEPGALTRVEVFLPVARTVAEGLGEKKVRRRLAPSTIWVVDDDAIFREMCHQVLTEEGHELLELSGGRELHGLWKKKNGPPNLIIMDFSMPEYNGLELCEWLRDHGSRVPVILVSGFSSKQPDIKKALKMKKTYFLQKPFTSRDLTDSVTVAMGETLIGE